MDVGREARLSEVFVELADTLIVDFDVIEFLTVLMTRCVELLAIDAAAVALSGTDGTLRPTAASAENARLLELFELQTDAGPCLDAFVGGRQVVNVDLTDEAVAPLAATRWPRFAEAVRAAGFVSAHALPLRLRETTIGVLNLFCAETVRLGAADVRLGQAFADVATIGILQQRALRSQETVATQLQGALDSRVAIEQAKGVLAQQGAVSVESAFELMRAYARRHNRRLSELAAAVVHGAVDAALLLGDGRGTLP